MPDTEIKETNIALPTAKEAAIAKKTSSKLAAILKDKKTSIIQLVCDSEVIEVPVTALRLFNEILEQIAQGNAVTLKPIYAELTTKQAADLLNVSRTHLVKLLDNGEIKHRKVGSHRRVLAEDILAYRLLSEKKRRIALDELTAYDQELGFQ